MASCRSTKHDADQNQGCGVALLLLSQQTWLQPQAMIGRYASASDASHAKKCTKHLQSSGKHSIDQKHDVWASKKTCAVYLDVGNHTNGSQSLFCRGLGQFIAYSTSDLGQCCISSHSQTPAPTKVEAARAAQLHWNG